MQIAQDVKAIVAREFGVELSAVQENDSFIYDLGADSLAIVELVSAIEEHFKIDIPKSETKRIRTVGDVITYLQTHRKAS